MKSFWLLACLIVSQATAAISVRDDAGNIVTLQKPAQRVISLAPHVTEMLFAAGGGERVVGVVKFSDYPEAAKHIQQVGDHRQIDIERVIALKPDLLVVWLHGDAARQLEQLGKLGIPLFYSEPRHLDGIADNLIRLGRLLGTDKEAQQAAADLRKQLADLAAQYANRSPVRVFYQVWDKPLYTLNGEHIVNDSIRLCGGENIFDGMKTTAPNVGIEAVLKEDPEAVISGDQRNQTGGGVNLWKPYTRMTAVRRGNLFSINGDLLNRATPRLIAGTAAICDKLEQARQHRKSQP